MDYNGLKPGLYLQVGENIKNIGTVDDVIYQALTGKSPDEVARLASMVGWVFIALNKRRTQMKELFRYGRWLIGEEERDLPFVFNWERDAPRVDEALQTTGQAYLLKQRSGRRLIGLRWLSPDAVEPDERSVEIIAGGLKYTRYFYTDDTGRRETLPGEDVVHFMLYGRDDIAPATTAGMATKLAAKVMYGVGETFATFYENNALPVMLVEVPATTTNADRERLENRFWRLFNPRRGSKENRTVGVNEGVKVTPLSIDPADLDATALEEAKIQEIVTAHDVPYEIVATAANYAVSQDRRRDFVGAIGQRVEEIAQTITDDPEIKGLRINYEANVEQHWSMKRDEADAAIALQRYTASGFTPWAAAWLMGISEDDFPEDIRERGLWVEMQPQAQEAPQISAPDIDTGAGGGDVADEMDIDDEFKMAEAGQFRRWYKKRMGTDPDQFDAKHLTRGDKLLIVDDILRTAWETYP
jgi:hypothetical protein